MNAIDNPDMEAVYDSGEYAVINTSPPPRQHAVRAHIYEDRFLQFEQKFFCDRPTEKTVTLMVSLIPCKKMPSNSQRGLEKIVKN